MAEPIAAPVAAPAAPAPATTGGTIDQFREAARTGALDAETPRTPGGLVVPDIGDPETLGHDNAAESDGVLLDTSPEADDAQPDLEAEADETAADPWAEQIHGMTARELVDAIKAGEVPAELAKQLQIAVKVNGEEYKVSVDEAGKGYQRLSDYTRAKQELRGQAQEVHAARQNMDRMIDAWKRDPAELRRGMKALGLKETLFEAAKAEAAEWYADQQLPPGERALKAQLAEMREQHEQAMQRLEQQRPKQEDTRTADLTKQLATLVPAGFAAAGITDSAPARQLFGENLRTLWEDGAELTADLVNSAAQATAEQLGDLARKHAKLSAPAAKPATLPARAGAAPSTGAKSNGAPMQQRSGTIADFRKSLGR